MIPSINEHRTRTPLMRPEWLATLHRMREHPDAPRWNIEIGDRLTTDDLAFAKVFEERLAADRARPAPGPHDEIVAWIEEQREHVPYFAKALAGIDIRRDFAAIPRMTRRDLQRRLDEIVPPEEPLDRLIVNPTAGTTGEPILAPNHPRAIGCYDPLIQFCLRRHGVNARYDHTMIAAIQMCFQKSTIVYNAVHSFLDGAGFAKINLDPSSWPRPGSAARYVNDMEPVFISGDPIAFMEMLRLGVDYRPRAILSCALALTADLRGHLESAYGCPVVDFYSLNETGPLAYSSPESPGCFHVLPHDIHLEICDDDGAPAPDGTVGEICVTGGRNPFLPLLRYRTGDAGRIVSRNGTAGDPSPLIELRDCRMPVLFAAPDGRSINPIDIARVIRSRPVESFQCVQAPGLAVTVRLPSASIAHFGGDIVRGIAELFDGAVEVRHAELTVTHGEKIIPFIKE